MSDRGKLDGLTHSAIAVVLLICLSCQNSMATGQGSLKERWYRSQSGYGLARPAYSGGVVFFGGGHGVVTARRASSGETVWTSSVGTDDVNGGNLAVRRGVVIVPVGNFTAGLDAQTGAELWKYFAPLDTISNSTNPPAGNVADTRIAADTDNVYIPAWGASISALDVKSGAVHWVWRPGHLDGDTASGGAFRSGSMGVRLSGDTLYATLWHFVTRSGAQSEAWVIALDRSNGREIWRYKLPVTGGGVVIEGSPVIYRQLAIVHTISGSTYAINRFAPSLAWSFLPANPTFSTVAEAELYDDIVYVDGGDGRLYALNALEGSILWSTSFPTQATRDILVTERRITLTNSRTLFVFDRLSGRLISQASQPRTADPLFASAACAGDGAIFIEMADAVWALEEP